MSPVPAGLLTLLLPLHRRALLRLPRRRNLVPVLVLLLAAVLRRDAHRDFEAMERSMRWVSAPEARMALVR